MEHCGALSALLLVVGAMTTHWNSVVDFSSTGGVVNPHGAWLLADPGEVTKSGSRTAAR